MFGGSNICRQLLGLAISEFNDACVGNFPNYSKYLIFGTHAAIAAVRRPPPPTSPPPSLLYYGKRIFPFTYFA